MWVEGRIVVNTGLDILLAECICGPAILMLPRPWTDGSQMIQMQQGKSKHAHGAVRGQIVEVHHYAYGSIEHAGQGSMRFNLICLPAYC